MLGWILMLAATPLHNVQVFANTCAEAQSGDIAGNIVKLYGQNRPTIAFTWSEGALMEPALTAATLTKTGHLSFVAKTSSGSFRFNGRLRPHALVGILVEPWGGAPKAVVLEERSKRRADHPSENCPNG